MSNTNRFVLTHRSCRRLGQVGFTLIELIVTIAIGTLMMMVAAPSYTQFQRNAQVSEAASSFIAAANTARANAMKQGLNTYLIPNIGTSWNSGWLVFTDSDSNQVFTEGTDEVLLRHEAISADVTITTPGASSLASGYLLFNGSGYPRLKAGGFSQATMVMRNVSRSSSIIVDLAGRVRSCRTDTTGC